MYKYSKDKYDLYGYFDKIYLSVNSYCVNHFFDFYRTLNTPYLSLS